ncbi:MAG: DUF1800 family protein [Alphaproteobacteria bacterium]|nr:DUF1800 family protein [Alphaproteobacteria bacterium]
MRKSKQVFAIAALLGLTHIAAPVAAIEVGDARHLLTRTGFAATTSEADELRALNRAAAVDRVLASARTEPASPPPGFALKWTEPPRVQDMNETERKKYQDLQRSQEIELKSWWMEEMANTPSPVTEMMTLFWHGHFTSSLQKVRFPALIYRQNQLFRQHALGNFGKLLAGIVHDPAMLIYLDNVSNPQRFALGQQAPNENLARELLELFTLGEGNYAETDIKEIARALTGYAYDPRTGEFQSFAARHDGGRKAILGQAGNFTGDDVVALLLADPRTSERIVKSLWVAFVSPQPDPSEVKRLAAIFRQNNYEMKPLLRALWLSDAFWAEANRGTLVKSPVELLVGTLRTFGVTLSEGAPLVTVARRMGQDLFDPPNVKGWPGGLTWINSDTYLQRQEIIRFVTGGQGAPALPRTPAPTGGLAAFVEAQAKAKAEAEVRALADAKAQAQMLAQAPPQPVTQLAQTPIEARQEARAERQEARAEARQGANAPADNAMGGVMAGPGAMAEMAPQPQMAAPPQPAANRPTPFGATIERWVRALPEVWLPSAQVASLLVPLPPVDIATLDPLASGAMVRRLLNDPVYQLK